MSLLDDSDHAAECLDHLQTMLWESGDHTQDEEISSIICMLQSPLFRHLLVLQDSVQQLKQLKLREDLEGYQFDFQPDLQLKPNISFEQQTSDFSYEPSQGYKEEVQKVIEKAAMGREVETIKLLKPEKQSLGFSVVANPGDPCIYVQDIQQGGIADRHGRLREHDQILAIDGQPLDISPQEAIRILQSASGIVELVVARGPVVALAITNPNQPLVSHNPDHTVHIGIEASEMLNTEWSQLEVIDLINDGTGLGFGIIGGRSTGVVVKTILPGGVADVDGRLHSGDHMLQIGDVDVRGFGSDQVAQVLRQAGSHVRLIVARPINEPTMLPTPDAPIVPTIQLDQHLEQILAMLEKQDQMLIENQLNISQPRLLEQTSYGDEPEVECFDVNLLKDAHQGLGITIAGYVGRDNNPDDLCGIFVKSITKDSAAAIDGQIQVNDQIIEVDGQCLQGFSNHDAVEVLRNTGKEVHLKLARYQHGAKFDKLQQYLAQPQMTVQPPTLQLPSEVLDRVIPQSQQQQQMDGEDINIQKDDEDLDEELSMEMEAAINAIWEPIIGDDFEVAVAQLSKFKEGGGLGISLEGTVDVENGVEVRPHHYIRAILPDGPVGLNGRLHSGDELLEVNGKRLLGLNHKEVVGILKELPQNVRLVCARRKLVSESFADETEHFQSSSLNSGITELVSERLVKSKSENSLSQHIAQTNLTKKSRSLEPLTGLAMWCSEPVVIELRKGDKGLGFSILDYQDPVNPSETVIVIRSLVPGGVAQMDGRLVPGDRLIFVNDINLESAVLDEAVQALKGAPKGIVRIGVAKPLPLSGTLKEQHVLTEHLKTDVSLLSSSSWHEHATTKDDHDYMNVEELDKFASLSAAGKYQPKHSWDSSVGEDVESTIHEKGDSFYESDKEDLSFANPSKILHPFIQKDAIEKPVIKSRPVPLPRKQDMQTITSGYGHEVAVAVPVQVHEHIEMQPRSQGEHVDGYDLDSAEMIATNFQLDVNEDSDMCRTETPSVTTLPLYEDVVSGDSEFFNMDDLDAPPVPLRDDSHETATDVIVNKRHVDSMAEEPPKPSPRKSPQETTKRTEIVKPLIPPKPSISLYSKVLTPTKFTSPSKDEPPPLPESSPPFLDIGYVAKSVSASSASISQRISPGTSPITSPKLLRSQSAIEAFPSELEKRITIKRSQDDLGISVETTENGINGCIVKSITQNGAIFKDGRIHIGDYIMSVNNENMRHITNTQARVILRRASLMSSTDISITYVTAADAALYKESLAIRPHDSPSASSTTPSPNSTLSTIYKGSSNVHVLPVSALHKTAAPIEDMDTAGTRKPQKHVFAGQKETVVVGSGNQTWGPPRYVELERVMGKSLGISIVGGRVDMFHVSEEHMISGIFIKHVLEDSPAGRNGTLKTGDRILQVDGKDLRNATHDQAVETIRKASNPVRFLVQSLTDPVCPTDLDNDSRSVHSFDEAIQQVTDEHINAKSPLPEQQLSARAAEDSTCAQQTVEQAIPITEEEDESMASQCNEESANTQSSPRSMTFEDQLSEMTGQSESVTEDFSKECLLRRYGELNGEIHLVELKRGSNGLGISLAGNKDRNTMSVFVAGIGPESAAAQDGRIQVGDELLEVNGNVLYGRSHLNASSIIKGLHTSEIKIALLRREDNLERMAVKPIKIASPVLSIHDVKADSVNSTVRPETTTSSSPAISEDSASNILDLVQVITLNKGPSGLGFAIVEDNRESSQGIYVRSITLGGVADRDGRLCVGDQILEVQDKTLTGVHYDKAIEILRNIQGNVMLKVRKPLMEGLQNIQSTVQQGQITIPSPGESSTDGTVAIAPSDLVSYNPLTCAIIPGQEMSITIEKGRTGLGLSIVGGADTLLGAIIIHEVYEDGAAARDGRLWAGDQILEVNGENLREATHDYAIQVLRQTPPTVNMLVFRDDTHVKEEDIYDVFTVELTKKPGKGLGLSIVGKRNDVGVYISDIVKGGAAEADGRLMQGDQILSVNEEDMRNATQEHAAAILKTTMGRVVLSVGRLKAGSRTSSRKNSSSKTTTLQKSESSASNKSKGGKHNRKSSEDASHIRTVELTHDSNGSLGLSIAGGVGSSLGDAAIIVANLTPSGPADRSRKLKVGDKILSVNGISTEGLNHEEVVNLLKSADGVVILQVTQGEQKQVSVSSRSSSTRGSTRSSSVQQQQPATILQSAEQDNSVFDDESAPPTYKTICLERGQDGLGFSIVGGHGSPHGDLPIYVKNVFTKGAASDDGQLKRGDQILSVNGTSLEGLTHEEAVTILKNSKGSVILNVLS